MQYRKRKIFYGSTGHFADLIPQMVKHKNEHYFVPLAENHNDDIKNMLDERRLNHVEGVMYRTVPNNFGQDETFDYDMLVFFSPSGVQSLLTNFPHFEQGDIAIATFGPTTAKAVRDAGLRLDIEAPTPQYPSITAAINDYISKHNKK